MADTDGIILHHYDLSPFSEKIRRILGAKSLAWHAVQQPMWLPRPHLTPITGPYRRIPVLQIGAEVWCDTRLIARTLERLHPEPTLYPTGLEAAAETIEQWADRHVFHTCVPQVFVGLAAMMPPELLADRQKMRPDLKPETLAAAVPGLRDELRAFVAVLERTLGAGAFLLGDRFSVADAAVFHVLWFVRNEPVAGAMLQQFPGVGRWMERVERLGTGRPEPMEPARALAIARDAEPRLARREDAQDPNGLRPGMRVVIAADDLPQDECVGEVVALAADEIVIRRESPECGTIAQHFPRAGYRVRAA